jgi:formylglycine-generating enzyme required for sulfatase activity
MGDTLNAIRLTVAAGAGLLLVLAAQAEPAKHHKPTAADTAVIKDCSRCPEMVTIPAGSFLMGSPATETHRGAETQHRVTIAAPFAVSRFEITFGQWDACVADGGCDGYRPDAPWGRGRMPVVNVSWNNAQAYVQWLSRKTGKRYRLLSEAEWEYAARGGQATAFAFGQTLSARDANFDASQKTDLNPKGPMRGRTMTVGAFKANGFGLHDVHGNVWEWVEDCWNEDYGPALPADGEPALAGDCDGHVLRGGSWEDGAADLRLAARVASAKGDRSWSDGIRVARAL